MPDDLLRAQLDRARAARARALGEQTASFGAHRAAQFGQGLGDLPGFVHVVTTEEIADLNTGIVHLKTDIMGLTIPDPIETESAADAIARTGRRIELFHLQRGYTNFKSEWDNWRLNHDSAWERTGDDVHRAFQQFRTEYNEWLRRFKQSFGNDKTQAKERKREQKADPLGAAQTTLNLMSVAVIGAVAVYAYSQVKK